MNAQKSKLTYQHTQPRKGYFFQSLVQPESHNTTKITMSFFNLIRPLFQTTTSLATSTTTVAAATAQGPTTFVRTLMKSHHGAAKRWRKTSTGWKRSQAARNHGNTGWGRGVLKSDSGKQMADKAQSKRLGKLLPYA